MARIKGVDIPNEKHISISLTSVYGIGRQLAKTIVKNAKVEGSKKVKDLGDIIILKEPKKNKDELKKLEVFMEKKCSCKKTCKCGCQEGKKCTYKDCNCGCHEGKKCTCGK